MKLLTTLAAATLAAPLLVTPAQAADIDDFVLVRALTICWVQTGRATIDTTMGYEWRSLADLGMTHDQYKVFNEQSGVGELIGDMVQKQIEERGGCSKWLTDLDNKPNPVRPARGGYAL